MFLLRQPVSSSSLFSLLNHPRPAASALLLSTGPFCGVFSWICICVFYLYIFVLVCTCSTIRPPLLSTRRLYFTSAHDNSVIQFMLKDTWKRTKICVSCVNCELNWNSIHISVFLFSDFVSFWYGITFLIHDRGFFANIRIDWICHPNATKHIKADSKLSNWHEVHICPSVE